MLLTRACQRDLKAGGKNVMALDEGVHGEAGRVVHRFQDYGAGNARGMGELVVNWNHDVGLAGRYSDSRLMEFVVGRRQVDALEILEVLEILPALLLIVFLDGHLRAAQKAVRGHSSALALPLWVGGTNAETPRRPIARQRTSQVGMLSDTLRRSNRSDFFSSHCLSKLMVTSSPARQAQIMYRLTPSPAFSGATESEC